MILFLRFFNSEKSIAYKGMSWPWRLTLYVKVTWPWKWHFLSLLEYMLQQWFDPAMLTHRDRKGKFQAHVTLRTRSPVKVTTLAYIPLTFLSWKTLETKKNHCCSMYTSRDRKCHFQGHVTLTYKVNRQGHDIRLYSIDFPGVKKYTNKNHCCSMYTSRDRKCHFQGHVTLTYKVNRQGHDIRLYSIDFPDVEKPQKHKKIIAVACIQARDRKCHF